MQIVKRMGLCSFNVSLCVLIQMNWVKHRDYQKSQLLRCVCVFLVGVLVFWKSDADCEKHGFVFLHCVLLCFQTKCVWHKDWQEPQLLWCVCVFLVGVLVFWYSDADCETHGGPRAPVAASWPRLVTASDTPTTQLCLHIYSIHKVYTYTHYTWYTVYIYIYIYTVSTQVGHSLRHTSHSTVSSSVGYSSRIQF